MKAIISFAATLGLLGSVPASAADWFDRVSERFDLIEQSSSGQILLQVNNGGIAITVPGRSSSCSATSVLITPPVNKEKDWLAMVLAAVIAGKGVTVYGNCNAATWQIESNRILVDYRS
ncbi:hypothetical protein [Peristeroidobacter soli]|uniref:hypothetical protein n=1 Tax=Peristeroidobacter soli TaxID=2497877 RepID=UPI00101C7624|nr:hypothetical protein [Peristeroidobacter soli]